MSSSTPTLAPSPELSPPIPFTPSKHNSLLPAFINLHITCISSPPHPILTFLPPFPSSKIAAVESWWRDRFAEVLAGTRHIVFVMVLPHGGEKVKIAGVCMVSTPKTETGPHQGFVEKFMVDPEFRGRGVGSGIMRIVEDVVLEKGAWLLNVDLLMGLEKMLDTDVGSLAEGIYRRMGYIECGRIPEYGVWSPTGELKTEVFFYKKLKGAEQAKVENEPVNKLN
ncbi:hypothetical protein NHQ30_004357 [Ciborinia camelliae]|nr:hypothetical protein NHQ30_004357 [Ciborinia camelliae]